MIGKGQTSVELLLVLIGVMLVLGTIYVIAHGQLTSSQNTVRVNEAKRSVSSLAGAAREVYSEGRGARRQVFVRIPEGNVPGKTGIYNESIINIGVYVGEGMTDVNEVLNFRVVEGANFPKEPGGYWVWVTSMGSYVIIGDTSWTVEPSYVSEMLGLGDALSKMLEVSNYLNSSITVDMLIYWNSSEVNVSFNGDNSTSVSLSAYNNPGDSVNVTLNISVSSSASFGTYRGRIVANGSDGGSMTIPLVIEVIGGGGESPVSYILIDTYNDSGYSTPATSFDPTESVRINGGGFEADSDVTIRIYDPTTALVHENTTTTDGSGSFTYDWDPGMPIPVGEYTVVVNDSSDSASWNFNITGCP